MMTQLAEQWVIIISTPIYLFLIGGELILSHLHQRHLYTWKDTITNVYLMLLNAGVDVLFRVVYLGVFLFCYQYAVVEWSNPIWYWVCLILV